MRWECQECGEINSDDGSIRCSCGYMDNRPEGEGAGEIAADIPRKKPLTARQIPWKVTRFIAIVLLFAWLTFIAKQTAGRPFFMGKVFTVTAFSLTAFCIYPASKVVGPRSILLAPVRGLRDGLFNIGWKFFPEDDGEREFHWFSIYSMLNPISEDMWQHLRYKKKPHYSVPEYKKYLESINKHLDPFATLPMKDKVIRQLRYRYFFRAAKRYNQFMAGLLNKEYGNDYYERSSAGEYMKNIRHHFQLFLQLRERTKKLGILEYADITQSNNKFWYILRYYITSVSSKLIYEDYSKLNLDCSGDIVREFLCAREDLLLQIRNSNSMSADKKRTISRIAFDTGSPIAKGTIFNLLKRECKNPEVQRYPRHPTRENNSHTTGKHLQVNGDK